MFSFLYLFLFAFLCFCMFVCVPCACTGCGGQKRALDSLEPQLQAVVSIHHVGSGPLQDQQVFFTAEQSLQPQVFFKKKKLTVCIRCIWLCYLRTFLFIEHVPSAFLLFLVGSSGVYLLLECHTYSRIYSVHLYKISQILYRCSTTSERKIHLSS